jgi:PleD family two-component response regulator
MKSLHRLFGVKEKNTNNICCSESEFREKLKIERSRTHRNAHEFSLILLKLEPLQLNRKKLNRMIQEIHNRIRDIDNMGWYDKHSIGIILPYTSAAGARGFVNNIIHSTNDLKQDTEYTLYTYPPEKKSIEENTAKTVLRN